MGNVEIQIYMWNFDFKPNHGKLKEKNAMPSANGSLCWPHFDTLCWSFYQDWTCNLLSPFFQHPVLMLTMNPGAAFLLFFFFFLFIRSYRCQNGNQEAQKGSLPVTFSLTMDVGCDQFSNFSTRLFVNRLDCRCSSPREQKDIFLWNVSRKQQSSWRNLPN